MSGAKGKSGGQRDGAGRKPGPRKDKKRYFRPPVEPAATELERLALEWWASLSPKQRLEQITEAHTFQPGYASRVEMTN
jgi:hypothetical protein